jgi:pimeloyl-ACP methyl ester carboxylesterase
LRVGCQKDEIETHVSSSEAGYEDSRMRRQERADRRRITEVATTTTDGVPLRGRWLRGLEQGELAVVVGHGFTHNTGTPLTERLLVRAARHADVLAFDLRGHGRSGGTTEVGGIEELDIDAAVAYARACGYRSVATLGFSMGACAVVKQAAQMGGVDVVAAVSSPASWFERSTRPMRRVNRLPEQPFGRSVVWLLGARLGEPWDDPLPACPLEVADRIAPTPLLIVHGTADEYFPVSHAHALHAAAGASSELWTPAGVGHGEKGMTPALLDSIVGWLVARTG